MTRFEILQRFSSDGKTEARHIALFHVLSEMWVSGNRPESFKPDLDEAARLLGIGYSTTMRWLNELEKFGYLELRRGRNQHEKSTLVFKVGHASTEIAPRQIRQYDVKRESEVMREMRQHDVKRESTASNERADFELSTSQIVDNQQNYGENADNPESAETFFVHNNNHLNNTIDNINLKKVDSKVIGDGKRVQGKNQLGRERREPKIKKTPFAISPLADIEKFREAFASDSTAKAADLDHYHARLLNWRDKKGDVPERADWLATAKTFLLNDYREGKLVTVTTVKPLNANANPRNNSRSAVIEPESTAGRRFGSW